MTPASTATRILYLLLDGFAPIITLTIVLWPLQTVMQDNHQAALLVGIVLLFVITMGQYVLLTTEGFIPDDQKAFLRFFFEPYAVMFIIWLLTNVSLLDAWVSLMLYLILTRLIGHLFSVIAAPLLVTTLSARRRRRYWMQILPAMGSLLLFCIYPLILGVNYLLDLQRSTDSALGDVGIWISLAVFGIGFIHQVYRYAMAFNPQSFIDYVDTV